MNPYVQRAIEKNRRRMTAERVRDQLLNIDTVREQVIFGGYRGLAIHQLDKIGQGSRLAGQGFYQVGGSTASSRVR